MTTKITFSDLLEFSDYLKIDGLYIDAQIEVEVIKNKLEEIYVDSIKVKNVSVITESEQSIKVLLDTESPFYYKLLLTAENKAKELASNTSDIHWQILTYENTI